MKKRTVHFKERTLEETIADIASSPQYCSDPAYVRWTAETTPARGKRVIAILARFVKENATLLDVGSSQGLTFGYLAQVFPHIVGVDIDAAAVATARKRLKALGVRAPITVYDGKKLPFRSSSFDGIVCTEVYEHVDDRRVFLRELHRVLKSDGILLITAPNKLYPVECEFHLPFLSYFPKKLADFYVRMSGKGDSYDHIDHPTYKQFRETLLPYFTIDDITQSIVKNYQTYHLEEERGGLASFGAWIIRATEWFDRVFWGFGSWCLQMIFAICSPGWVFICKKRV